MKKRKIFVFLENIFFLKRHFSRGEEKRLFFLVARGRSFSMAREKLEESLERETH